MAPERDGPEAWSCTADPNMCIVGDIPVDWHWVATDTRRMIIDVGFEVGALAWAGFNTSQLPETDWD